MAKVILYTALTMDGFISGKNDELDWLFHDQDYGYQEFYSSIGSLLWGHTTWRIASQMPEFVIDETRMNYLFSRSYQESGNGAVQYITSDITEFVESLKKTEKKNIWLVGGGEINGILLQAGLIDEMVLSYHPVFLGTGKPLFRAERGLRSFRTKEVQKFSSGLVQMRLMKD